MASLRKPNGDGVDYFEAEENDYGLINVITATGKTIPLQVKGLDSISNIKLKIEAQEDIPCRQQKLIFNEKLLQDDDILGNFCIKKGSTLKLMRNSKGFMNIFIKTPDCGPWPSIGEATPPPIAMVGRTLTPKNFFPAPLRPRTLSLEVKPSDTIGSVKAKMKCVVDVLIFNEIVLDDTDTLADLNIINGSTLTSMVKYVIYMEIFVSFNSGKTITLLVNPTYTITKVKSMIEREEGVPVDEQVLIFNKVVLRDSGTLSDFHINRKSTLTLMRRSRKSKEPMKIFFKTLTGETVTKKIKPSDTVNRIKSIIQDKVHIPHHEQELIFKEMVLDNNGTLASYNINNKSTLTVMRVSG